MDDNTKVEKLGPDNPPRWGIFPDRPIYRLFGHQYQVSKHGMVFDITGMPSKPGLADVLDAILNPTAEETNNLLGILEEMD
jgi:hypothetical protein